MNSHTLTFFPALEDSASHLKPKGLRPSDSRKSIRLRPQFSANIGQMCPTTETFAMFPEDDATSLLGDSLANPFRRYGKPGAPKAKQMTAICGRQCFMLSRSGARLGLLVKTLLESSIWHSTLAYLIWKTSVTPSNRLLFQLVPWAPSTSESGSGFWPTPQASDALRLRKFTIPQLAKAVARNRRNGTGGGDASLSLPHQISVRSRFCVNSQFLPSQFLPIVEAMMGFPPNWTRLDATETPSSRKSRKSSPEQSNNP